MRHTSIRCSERNHRPRAMINMYDCDAVYSCFSGLVVADAGSAQQDNARSTFVTGYYFVLF